MTIDPTGAVDSTAGLQALLEEGSARMAVREREIRASRRTVRGFVRWVWFGWTFPSFTLRLAAGTFKVSAPIALPPGVTLSGQLSGMPSAVISTEVPPAAMVEVHEFQPRLWAGSRIGRLTHRAWWRIRWLVRDRRREPGDDGDWPEGDDDGDWPDE